MRCVKRILGFVVTFALFITFTIYAQYIPSNKDTKLPPEEVEIIIEDPTDFQLLKETENFIFYFKDERDIFAIFDKRNNYLWKTGLDVPFVTDIMNACKLAPIEKKAEVCIPIEDRLSDTYVGLANSLVTIEYYAQDTIRRNSSAGRNNVSSDLKKVVGDDSHYILNVNFTIPHITLKVHIYLTDKGISYEVKYDEIVGRDKINLLSIILTPFLGASGGKLVYYNPGLLDENGKVIDNGGYSGNGEYLKDPVTGEIIFDDFDNPIKNKTPVPKYIIPGYVLVPDGAGALIRFTDYDTELGSYIGRVFGEDYSHNTMYYTRERGFVKYKQPNMPVYGIAHGNDQAAFIGYSSLGSEYLEIIVTPDEVERTHYNWAYPRFVYNTKYFQVYNRTGAGYEKTLDEDQKSKFDIKMNYEFLANDGSEDGLPANYIGMAKAYRNYLIEEGILTPIKENISDIPIRIDFVMADAKRNIIGFDDVVVTTIEDVKDILTDLKTLDIHNINSGLIGYQKGGVTLGKPYKISYSRSIGSKKDYQSIIKELAMQGIDVSFVQDFVKINEEQMSLRGNALRHATNWYTRTFVYDAESPINTIYYARATKSKSWINDFLKEIKDIPFASVTVDGIQNILFSDYTNGLTTRKKTISIYQDALKNINKKYKINAKNPNQYTWHFIDRYLDAPIFNTQYLFSTDTVPFLQLVLQGTMELYAPYSNFSLYTDKDILRMIDYNVYPSFVLTKEPAHYLMATNSANYYSTEYDLYKELIGKIYHTVNDALSNVIGSDWINRTVVANGVIVNTYSNGIEIVINYTEDVYYYEGVRVEPISYKIID